MSYDFKNSCEDFSLIFLIAIVISDSDKNIFGFLILQAVRGCQNELFRDQSSAAVSEESPPVAIFDADNIVNSN